MPIQQFIEKFAAKDIDALCELYADDAINHQSPEPPLHGKVAIRESFKNFFAAFPGEKTDVVNIYEDGDWAIWEWKGYNDALRPDPDKRYEIYGCGFFKIKNGKIVVQRGYWDKLEFLKSRGVEVGE